MLPEKGNERNSPTTILPPGEDKTKQEKVKIRKSEIWSPVLMLWRGRKVGECCSGVRAGGSARGDLKDQDRGEWEGTENWRPRIHSSVQGHLKDSAVGGACPALGTE